MSWGRVKIDAADRYMSLFVRWRDDWKCQRCGRQYQPGDSGLQNSHFHGRGKEATRFDPQNCTALCTGCHMHFTAQPAEHHAWQLARMGKKQYDALMVRANSYCKKDRKLAKLYAVGLIRQLEKERNVKIL